VGMTLMAIEKAKVAFLSHNEPEFLAYMNLIKTFLEDVESLSILHVEFRRLLDETALV